MWKFCGFLTSPEWHQGVEFLSPYTLMTVSRITWGKPLWVQYLCRAGIMSARASLASLALFLEGGRVCRNLGDFGLIVRFWLWVRRGRGWRGGMMKCGVMWRWRGRVLLWVPFVVAVSSLFRLALSACAVLKALSLSAGWPFLLGFGGLPFVSKLLLPIPPLPLYFSLVFFLLCRTVDPAASQQLLLRQPTVLFLLLWCFPMSILSSMFSPFCWGDLSFSLVQCLFLGLEFPLWCFTMMQEIWSFWSCPGLGSWLCSCFTRRLWKMTAVGFTTSWNQVLCSCWIILSARMNWKLGSLVWWMLGWPATLCLFQTWCLFGFGSLCKFFGTWMWIWLRSVLGIITVSTVQKCRNVGFVFALVLVLHRCKPGPRLMK